MVSYEDRELHSIFMNSTNQQQLANIPNEMKTTQVCYKKKLLEMKKSSNTSYLTGVYKQTTNTYNYTMTASSQPHQGSSFFRNIKLNLDRISKGTTSQGGDLELVTAGTNRPDYWATT